MLKNKKNVIGLIALVLVTAVVTFGISLFVFYGWGYFNPKYEVTFDPAKVNIANIQKFQQVRNVLLKEYYEDVDENALVEGAISGMAEALKDPYTVYFTKDQMKKFMETSEGSYVGIGVSVNLDSNGLLTVVEPFENSPAKKVGILQGDKIIKVDDKDVSTLRDEDLIIKMIKGQENTKVKLTVFRPSEGKPFDFDIIRKKIKIDNIKSEMLSGGMGYIRIVMFDGEIAKDFEAHLTKLLAQKMKGLVIDVRDNPGGTYEQVVAICDRLLPEGIIVYTEDKQKRQKIEKSGKSELGLPMVVLTNGNSASASEILAGALKDNKKGVLVGTKTFGKGLVQAIQPLTDGAGLKVTIARYFTPSGNYIHGVGVQPDVEVQLPEKYKSTPVSQIPREEDSQMKAAVEELRKRIK